MTNLTTPAPPLPDLAPATAPSPRAIFGAAVAAATPTIGAVRPEHMGARTPCEDFDVRALLGHLVDVLHRVAIIGRAGDIFSVPPVVAGAVADGAWLGLWQARVPEARTAWADDAALAREVVLPWSTASGADTLVGYAAEVFVHTWDLAQATDHVPRWDDPSVAAALAVDERRIPGGNRLERFAEIVAGMPADRRPARPAFDEVVAVAATAPLIEQLVAWTGRDPQWSAA